MQKKRTLLCITFGVFLLIAIQRIWSSSTPLDEVLKEVTDDEIFDESSNMESPSKYAIFLQLGINSPIFTELLQCASNTAAAMKGDESLDIYLSILEHDIIKKNEYKTKLAALPAIDRVFISSTDNEGGDVGQFLVQLKLAANNRSNYASILKTHAKSNGQWRRRMLESLCGSPNQVRSILNGMAQSEKVKIVAPLGTTFGPFTPIDLIYPRIPQIYGMNSCTESFDPDMILQMEKLYSFVFNNNAANSIIPHENLAIVAGSSFWIN